jgi:cytochrome c oxidase subunit 4
MKRARPIKEYLLVYFALMILLGLTLGSAFLDLGPFNPILNLGISCLKAALVVAFFMHIQGAHSLTKVFAGTGIFWLGILFSLVATDYLSRGWLPLPGNWPQTSVQEGRSGP